MMDTTAFDELVTRLRADGLVSQAEMLVDTKNFVIKYGNLLEPILEDITNLAVGRENSAHQAVKVILGVVIVGLLNLLENTNEN